jgi:predicted phage terminase large subunit-like protein
MEGNLRWLLQSAVPSLDPMKGRIAIIGTPIHQRCMVETLKEMKGWDNMLFRPDLDNEVALWEEWQPIKKLKKKKEELESINRVSVFYREYMCEVVGDEDQLFKESYFQYYEGKLEYEDNHAFLRLTELNGERADDLRPVNVFMGVDPASSTRQTADYSTIVTVAIDKDGNRFVLPYYRNRATPMNVAEAIMTQVKVYRPDKTRIESVGYQEMLREYIRKRCEEEGIFIPGLEIKETPRNSKSSRLETMEPYFAQKKFYMTKEQMELRDELLMYPRGKHDDLLDGLFYATKGIYTPHHKAIDKENERVRPRILDGGSDWKTA